MTRSMQDQTLVIVGGGFAGLITAQLALPYFSKVRLVDGDPLLGTGKIRKGCSQAAHLHVLMKKGQEILFSAFPNLRNRLVRDHCQEVDWGSETIWSNRMGQFPRQETSINTLMVSRLHLEKCMYEDLLKSSKFERIQLKVKRIEKLTGPDGRQQIESVSGEDLQKISGDCYVFCPGAGYPIAKILASGRRFAKETVSEINVSYESLFFDSAKLAPQPAKQAYYQVTPGGGETGAVISPVENKRYVATLIEMGKAKVETNIISGKLIKDRNQGQKSFRQRLGEVPNLQINRVSQSVEAEQKSVRFKKIKMFRRVVNYSDVPSNALIIGDVLCSLNPVFGQGMTVAAMQAVVVEDFFAGRINHALAVKSIQKKSEFPFSLAYAGSQEDGVLKFVLDSFFRLMLRSRRLHQLFLRILHFQKKVEI